MRFSLQEVRKSVHRREGELFVSLHFLRQRAQQSEIEQLIGYHERCIGQPQKSFVVDDARAYIGEYRLANCLIATLSNWYSWRSREWTAVVQEVQGSAELLALASAPQLRLALYNYVNATYHGFLDSQQRQIALQTFAARYAISGPALEYLLALDGEDETLLVRGTEKPPTVQEVTTRYNQWVFEAALFNASQVRFVIDCNAFQIERSTTEGQERRIVSGVGAVIKRLCYLARHLGVYYDLAYEDNAYPAPQKAEKMGSVSVQPQLLTLTLYGPQEVTGAPQQYGMRLARLCRILLGYGVTVAEKAGGTKKASFGKAVVEAQARIHFLQRAYTFVMDAQLLQLLPEVTTAEERERQGQVEENPLFDSRIEQSFAEAFQGSASSQGVDGWHLEREPEPLLLEQSIFIPDFAFTRGAQRIYVEILGFWTPSYRERKVQKLQQLRARNDLLLAIPGDAKAAFESIEHDFPIVYYTDQLSVTSVLQVLRERYNDFDERLDALDMAVVSQQIHREQLTPERACYILLDCYRSAELQRAVERVLNRPENVDIAFMAGVGLYQRSWMEQVKSACIDELRHMGRVTLEVLISKVSQRWSELQNCEDATIESMLGSWTEISIQRSSIFDVQIELAELEQQRAKNAEALEAVDVVESVSKKKAKSSGRDRRAAPKRQVEEESETVQGNLWE